MKLRIPFLVMLLVGTSMAGTVTDSFRRLPKQPFTEGPPAQLVRLMENGQGLIDVKNGFLRLDGDGAQVSLQVALFRFEDDSPLLIVAWGNLEEPDFTHLTLFREKGGAIVEVDRKILAVADSDDLRFELPRHGRTIIVRNSVGKVVSKWTWNGTAFFKQP